MSYSDFTLAKVTRTFDLKVCEHQHLFADTPERQTSDFLQETLRRNVQIAISSNSEKARSEMIIAPILVELREQMHEEISLFSGIDFSVAPEQGLNGICDFLISQSPGLMLMKAPVLAIVEAKKEDLNAGLGQCVAEMYAATLFNQANEIPLPTLYGTVTSGTNWRFLTLEEQTINIDLDEYYLSDLNKILGILASSVTPQKT